jgi:hypothetical protein
MDASAKEGKVAKKTLPIKTDPDKEK